jgi:4-amino-4-deoxy-L-arabinose transferase-like glycosyltransferase
MHHRLRWIIGLVCLAVVFAGSLTAVHFLASDEDDDGPFYENLARNVLERGVYSASEKPPYKPTFVRMPGYPLFIAGVYALCGRGNDWAIRVGQTLVHTGTVALLALLAWLWEPEPDCRWWSAVAAFGLAAVCPFMVIYAGCILTETLTMCLLAAMMVCATLAWRRQGLAGASWWALAGLLGGLGVLQRPDFGLFAAALGLTLLVGATWSAWRLERAGRRAVLQRALVCGAVFSAGFILAVSPWIVRNALVFGQPHLLPPVDCNEPGEFSPQGYIAWFGTWADDESELDRFFWTIGPDQPMNFAELPAQAFDNPDERRRVDKLFAVYNSHAAPVMMTPAIDLGFAQLAEERNSRAPWRSRLWLPLRRGINLWFGTHAQYYPFEGNLFPIHQKDDEPDYFAWRLVFTVLTSVYTMLGVWGAWLLWRAGGAGWRWLCLLALVAGLRLALLVQLAHTEARYVVEFFPFLCVLGGIAVARLAPSFRRGSLPLPRGFTAAAFSRA